jgi:proteasome alpha subunit
MQPDELSHQAMGYDRTSIMFSPDGRLLQVEYAKKTVKQGSNVIGMVCKDGVLLVGDKRIIEKLIVGSTVEKIFQIDDHIGAAASGILSDGRISTESLVKEICNVKQMYTQVGGARPFGVSILFVGVGENKHVFVTDPTGIFFGYKATAIGEADNEIKEILNRDYKESMNLKDGLKLSLSALKKVLGKDFSIDRVEGAYIKADEKKFTRLTKDDFSKVMK